MAGEKKILVLFDAHALIHRAYHALPEFFSAEGEPTGALYGLSSMLLKIISDLRPDYAAVCYDRPEKTFRHEAYGAYKAGRVKADPALVSQLASSRHIFEAFGIPVYDAPGFEADDVIGTIVKHVSHPSSLERVFGGEVNVIIVTGDMDALQLVEGKRVRVYALKKGLSEAVLYDEEEATKHLSFPPKYLPDYKGLSGDPSDNLKGIKGVGEKTAVALIKEFGTIESLYEDLREGGPRAKTLGLSERMLKLLERGEEDALFSKTLGRIRADAPIDFSLPGKTFMESAKPEKIKNVFLSLGFRSLLPRLEKLFPRIRADSTEGPPCVADVRSRNDGELEETSIALWLLDSERLNPGLPEILAFAGTDSLDKAREVIFRKLREEGLWRVFEEIELPLLPIVRRMRERGILVDREYFKNIQSDYRAELGRITARIYALSGTEFNINSPKQLSDILFSKMGLDSTPRRGRKTPGGVLSTRVSVLEKLSGENPVVREVLAYRELAKLLSTYIDTIPGMLSPDGRLRASFLQAGSSTGRFASRDPNLQNLPVRTDLGRRIRTGFVATQGHRLLSLDYSQIELRAAAILSGDPKMKRIFSEGRDIHTGVAAYVFGVPFERVDAEMRRRAKTINFGIIYGMGVTALQKDLMSTRAEAQEFYDNYFRQFSGLFQYLSEVKSLARERGYTETLFGRRRRFPNISSPVSFLRSVAERGATNAPIQGTAADIIKLAIRFADGDLSRAGLLDKAHLILQIHDELVYEVEEGALAEAEQVIKKAMATVLERSYLRYKTDVPLVVHSSTGQNLGELK